MAALGSLVALTAASLVALMGARQPSAAALAAATVNVDAATNLGTLNNPSFYQNHTGTPLGPGDLERLKEIGPVVARQWAKPKFYYDRATGTYTFPTARFDETARNADSMLFNFGQCDPALMTLSAPETCRAVLKAGIKYYKERYPELRYIELFNEPDKTWTPSPDEEPAIPVDQYYQWYKIGYSVVNEVNAELAPAVPLRIGGPAAYKFNPDYLKPFLDLYKADTNPAKRLDFVSYHQYNRRDNPADVKTSKSTFQEWLTSRGLDLTTPVFVTEYGVFPGAETGTTFEEDLLTQAAAMATLGYYFVDGGMDMPMHWTYDHSSNDRKSMFVDAADGAVYPYYNLVKMQRMLKTTRISATSSALSTAGIGVNALATRDSSGSTGYSYVDVDFGNKTLATAGAHSFTFTLTGTSGGAYTLAVDYLELVPVGRFRYELEKLVPESPSGDRFYYLTDPAASGGGLVKLGSGEVGDRIEFTVYVPQPGSYQLSLGVKTFSTRGTCQVSVDGAPLGAPQDQYAATASFVERPVGSVPVAKPRNLTVGCEVTGKNAASTGYDLVFDHLTLAPAP
jgi:hypothetical protein